MRVDGSIGRSWFCCLSLAMAASREDTCVASTAQPISAAMASPAAAKMNGGLLPELFLLLGPRFRDARRVQQSQAGIDAVGKPELFDELRT